MTENAVLNANYVLSLLKDVIEVPYSGNCMHEFVASGNRLKTEKGITTMDIAKRLIDFGIHPPTVYFPLLVKEAMMVEPTETESIATLEYFADTLKKILTEDISAEDGSFLHNAPYTTDISRPDEVAAAKNPVLVSPIAG
jgi:glycine dehydrogenase subunit 2